MWSFTCFLLHLGTLICSELEHTEHCDTVFFLFMCVRFSGSIRVFDLKSHLWCFGDLFPPLILVFHEMTGVSFLPSYAFGSVSYRIFLSVCILYI